MGDFGSFLKIRIILGLIVIGIVFLLMVTVVMFAWDDMLSATGFGILTLLLFAYGIYYWQHKHRFGTRY